MTTPNRRRWFRFSLAALFVAMTAFGGWLGYELNWIRQRRALVREGDTLYAMTSNYVTGITSDDLPPVGSTLSQRLLGFLGEPATKRCFVWVRNESPAEVDPADLPKVRRAQRLLPEAELVVVWFQPAAFAGYENLAEIDSLISQ